MAGRREGSGEDDVNSRTVGVRVDCRTQYHSIPPHNPRTGWKHDRVESHEKASAGTNVILVSCGVDGVPADLQSWRLFLQKWKDQKGLQSEIRFAKDER